jgi:RNA polymerase sigma-70 factor, ECF subfamily
MHNLNVNLVRHSISQGVAVNLDDANLCLVVPTDHTGALTLRDLDRALVEIPEEQGRVILLISLEGITYEEAAAILDVPLGTIRSRLSRGRAALHILMGSKDGAEAKNRAAISKGVPDRRRFVAEATVVGRAQTRSAL